MIGASSWSRRMQPAAAALVAFLVQLPVFDRTMSLMDEGHILQFADILRRGGELYRDANLLPLPGAFYLLGGAFELFGPSIRVARWLVVVEFSLLALLVFVLMRRIVGGRWAWGAVGVLLVYKVWAFPHWLMYSYSTTSLTLLAAGLVALLQFLEGGRRALLALAGLATGLGILCKQDYGAAVWLALNAVLVVAGRARATAPLGTPAVLAWFNVPAAGVGLVTAAHYLGQGLFGEMLQQTVLNHLVGIASFEYTSLPPLRPLLEPQEMLRTPFGIGTYAPSILFTADWETWRNSAFYAGLGWDWAVKLFFYAPYAIVAFGAARLLRGRRALADPGRRPAWLRELALFAFAASLVLALNKPVDYVHLAVLYWPLLLLLLVWAHAALQGRARLARVAAWVALLPALCVVAYSAWLLRGLVTTFDTPLRGERAGIRVKANEETVIGGAADYLRTHSEPDQRIAVLPYFPLISFLAARDAPDPTIYTFWPVAYVPDREARIAAAIEASGADFLLYHFTQWPQLPRLEEFAPDLFAWLVEHYAMETLFSDPTWGYQLAVLRRAPEPAGRPLDAGASGVRLFVEAGGRRRSLPEGRRAWLLWSGLWPFRPVLALRPLSGDRRSVLSIPIDVPAGGGRLQTAIGVHPSFWFRFPPTRVDFALRAVADGEDAELFAHSLDPHQDPSDRGWLEVEVPLDRWAGRRIALELSTHAGSPLGEVLEMGGWAQPRLLEGGGAPEPVD